MEFWLGLGLGGVIGAGGFAAWKTVTGRDKRPKIDPESYSSVRSAEASQVLPRLRLDDRVSGTPWGALRVVMLVHDDDRPAPVKPKSANGDLSQQERNEWEQAQKEWSEHLQIDRNRVESALINSMKAQGFHCLGVSASVERGRILAIAFRCPPAPKAGGQTHAEKEYQALVDTSHAAPTDVHFVVTTPNWTLVSDLERAPGPPWQDPSPPPPKPTPAPPKLVGVVTDCHAAIRLGSDAPAGHAPITMAERTQKLLGDGTREVKSHRKTT